MKWYVPTALNVLIHSSSKILINNQLISTQHGSCVWEPTVMYVIQL